MQNKQERSHGIDSRPNEVKTETSPSQEIAKLREMGAEEFRRQSEALVNRIAGLLGDQGNEWQANSARGFNEVHVWHVSEDTVTLRGNSDHGRGLIMIPLKSWEDVEAILTDAERQLLELIKTKDRLEVYVIPEYLQRKKELQNYGLDLDDPKIF